VVLLREHVPIAILEHSRQTSATFHAQNVKPVVLVWNLSDAWKLPKDLALLVISEHSRTPQDSGTQTVPNAQTVGLDSSARNVRQHLMACAKFVHKALLKKTMGFGTPRVRLVIRVVLEHSGVDVGGNLRARVLVVLLEHSRRRDCSHKWRMLVLSPQMRICKFWKVKECVENVAVPIANAWQLQ